MPTNINTLRQDIAAINSLRDYRDKIGSGAKCGYAHSWWQILMVALTYADKPVSVNELAEIVSDRLGMKMGASCSTLFARAAAKEAPCAVRREYTKSLPLFAKITKLQVKTSKSTGKGRPPLLFSFKDASAARQSLVHHIPSLDVLFALCDTKI